jgi:hypothetical protein
MSLVHLDDNKEFFTFGKEKKDELVAFTRWICLSGNKIKKYLSK